MSTDRVPVAPTMRVGVHLFLGGGPLREAVASLLHHADIAFAAGLDVVSFGEHHGETPGYLPEVWSAAAAVLAVEARRRVGVYPFLVGLRPPVLAREAMAVAAATHPGRLSIAIAPGYAQPDFDRAGVSLAEARQRCSTVLDDLADRDADFELLVAGAAPRTVQAAAQCGAGLLLPPLSPADERAVIARYTAAGGRGSVVAQRWLAVDDGDLSLYADLASPWAPVPRRCRSAEELAAMLDEAATAGVAEVSLRVGGPQHPGGFARDDVLSVVRAGRRLWESGSGPGAT